MILLKIVQHIYYLFGVDVYYRHKTRIIYLDLLNFLILKSPANSHLFWWSMYRCIIIVPYSYVSIQI